MKRVIDGVEYEAVKKNYDTCNGCVGYFSRNHLCKILQDDCKCKIWKISEKKSDDTDQSSVSSSNNEPCNCTQHLEALLSFTRKQ